MRLRPFEIERFYARHEFTARYMLSSSDSESRSAREILGFEPGADVAYLDQRLGYTESPGAPALRAAIASIYGTISPADVLVHSGAEEALWTFFEAAIAPGDHVIIQTPCYASARELPRALGASVSDWRMRFEDAWVPDLEGLERLIRPTTRVLYLNSPHNPTGYQFPIETFRHVIELAARHGLLVFSDEVYRELEHNSALRLPAACDVLETAVSLGVMSKTYGLPGLRIGWVATRNGAVLERMAMVKDYTTICNSAPSEFLATIALRHRDKLVQRNLSIVRRNLPLLNAFFARHAELFDWLPPEAGPIGFPRLKLEREVQQWCDEIVAASSVLLLPGTVYETPRHFRVGFGRENMPEALGVLEAHLDTLPFRAPSFA
jgi:aspartate/methionine/tyrosine aminotransferase